MDDDYEGIDGDDLFDQDGPGLFEEPVVEHAAPADPDEIDDDSLADESIDAPTVAEPRTLEAPAARHQPRPVDEAPAAPLALYRRYRPESFAEVIGQEHVTEPLQRALSNNKVNHAYLFSGPRGCGKTTSARILARCLNCEQGPTPTPCGVCQSCRDLSRGGSGSIDVIEIDAASHGGVEDTRDLRERAFFAPVHSRYKIYIIDEAHMVTTAGFNAMLKLVEEPPPHVKFIFATTEPEKVIGTIRSRTHHYPFRLVPPKVLQSYLGELCTKEGVTVDQTVLPLVVRAGAGSVRDSLSVLDQLLGGAGPDGVSYQQASALLGYTPDALLDEIVDAFAAGDSAGVFATIDKVIEVGQDPRRFAEDLLRRLRDLVIVAAVPDAVASGLIDVSGDQAERLQTQAAGMGAGELTRAAEVIATGLTDMRGTTAPRLYLELMCSRVLLPGADVDGRGIHARLDRLERRIGMAGAPDLPADPNAARWSDTDLAGAPSTARPTPVAEPAPEQRPARPQLAVVPQQFEDAPPPPPQAQRPAAPQQIQPSAPVGNPATPSDQSVQAGPSGQQGAAQRPADDQQAPAAQQPAQAPAAPSPEMPAQQPAQPAPGAPQGQRPAGQPQGQRPAGGQRPAPVAAPVPSEPVAPAAPAARAAGGSVSVADVRRLWPQVLDEVKSRRRFAWILLSQNAQVVDAPKGQLVLGFSNAGARDSFMSGGSSDVLRDSIIEVMGADLRIEAIVENGTHPTSGQTAPAAPAPAAPAPNQQGAARPAEDEAPMPSEPVHEAPPEDSRMAPSPVASAPSAPAVPQPAPAADTHRWTDEAKQNIRPTATGPAPAPEVVDESQLVSDDDETLDESGESATALITRALGGQVIAEESL